MENKKEEKTRLENDYWHRAFYFLIFAVVGGSFWRMVEKDAEKVKEEEARAEAEALTAIYLETGEFLKMPLFAVLKMALFFTAEIPEEGIYNRNGKLIQGDLYLR